MTKLNNFTSTNDVKESFFGILSLNDFLNETSKEYSFYGSQIIQTKTESEQLLHTCEFNLNDKWTLLYRGSRDGFGADKFHSICDTHSNTLTLISVTDNNRVFGAYTSVPWYSGHGEAKADAHSFIFSLKNREMKPRKMKILASNVNHAVFMDASHGPVFGCKNGVCDLIIANNSNVNELSCSRLGANYEFAQFINDKENGSSFLAGACQFRVKEIEIYQKGQ